MISVSSPATVFHHQYILAILSRGLGSWTPLNNSTLYESAGLCLLKTEVFRPYLTVVPHCTVSRPVLCWEWSYVCAADHYRKCSDKMWRDGEADWWSRAGVNPKCRHQLPDTFQKLSGGWLQNHPGELDCWQQVTFTFHWTLNFNLELTLNTSTTNTTTQKSYWTLSSILNSV